MQVQAQSFILYQAVGPPGQQANTASWLKTQAWHEGEASKFCGPANCTTACQGSKAPKAVKAAVHTEGETTKLCTQAVWQQGVQL